MKKVLRTKNNNKIKSTLSITKYPYLLTTYNKNYNTPKNIRSNKSYHNHSHYKMTINENNTFSLYNPDEEYVTKLNFFNIGTKNGKMNKNKITLYNLNTVPVFPSILKKDTDNVESFKEKKRILNELNLKQTLFDKVNNAENSKQTYVNRYENTFKENQLEKERKEIEKKIIKLKEMIKSLSNELSTTIQEIDNLKLDVDVMQNFRSYNLFNNNPIKSSTNETKDENYKRRKSINIKENESNIEKEKEKENKFKIEMMLLSNSEKVFKIKQEMKEKLKELEDKKVLLLDKINICENELKKFKGTYHNIKEELLVHYHRLLSEGKDTRKEGLSWIILAIWNLKSNVLLSYLPKFLDQNIILFLFEYSSLLKKIKETEKKIRELALKLKDQKEYIKTNSNDLNNLNEEDNYKNYIYRNNKEEKINNNNEIENKNNEDNEEEEEEEEEEENEDEEVDNKGKKEVIENDEIIKEDANENNASNTKSNIINNESKINKKNNKSKLNEIDEKKEINDEKNKIKNLKEERKNDINLQTQFGETFKTSLYNTNSDKRENNDFFFENKKYKKEDENFEKDFGEIKEKKKIKERNNIIKNISSNFFKSLFKKEDLYKKGRDNENKEKKIKLNDFKNIYNNNKNSLLFDYKTFELFNEHKNMEKYCQKLKEKAELLMKKELDRVSKSFYLYDYGGKYNVDQRVVISALVGEDSVRGELIKQKKQEKEYFKTLRELRNGKISQKS